MSVLSDIDQTLSMLLPVVQQQQAAYFADHGVYYQMMWTHSDPPSDYAPPDNLAQVPIGQTPAVVLGLPDTMRSRVRIDTYGKPDGWTLTLQTQFDGAVWQRAVDCGVKQVRSADWQQVVEPAP